MSTSPLKKITQIPRRLYEWTLDWATHPRGVLAYVVVAFTESIFFPIPVDPLLLAMCTANYRRSLYYAFIGCAASLLGAVAGYFIGFQFGDWAMQYLEANSAMTKAIEMFKDNTVYAMFIAGFTFLPFKVFTLSAGIAQVAFWPFLLGSVLGRGLRFFLVGGLVFFFGPTIKSFIDKYLEKIIVVLFLLCVVLYYFYKF